jgi:UDP-N-acetylmuramoyl-L-alanyl-D-glutamate--2,6-diaminopimelate ligase
VESPLLGLHNVYNVLSAVGASLALGISWEHIISGIKNAGQVEGRFESVDLGQDFLCIVDYAHTEDALRRLILTAKQMVARQTPFAGGSRIITVFGCGGQRDRGKRPAMGALSTELSDMVFITSDNPRNEDPEAIIGEIVAGARGGNFEVVPERREAIEKAISMARPGDIVLIAGKGHEEYQEIKGVRHPFSDREAAREEIRRRLALR